jgi:hypothetical protein
MDTIDKKEWEFDVKPLADGLNIKILQQLDFDAIFRDATTNEDIAECLSIMASRIQNDPTILVISTKRNSGNNGWLAQCAV